MSWRTWILFILAFGLVVYLQFCYESPEPIPIPEPEPTPTDTLTVTDTLASTDTLTVRRDMSDHCTLVHWSFWCDPDFETSCSPIMASIICKDTLPDGSVKR